MPEFSDRHTPDNDYYNHDRYQSPKNINSDRYTPIPNGNAYGKKIEVFYLDNKNNSNPIHDKDSYEPSSSSPPPPMNNFQPSSNGRIEVYYLNASDNNDDIPRHSASPPFMNNNRISPTPYQNSNGGRAEMYHFQINDDDNYNRQTPFDNDTYQKSIFSDNLNSHDDHDPKKVTVYLLTTTDEENRPPTRIQRTPSPPIRPVKKQQPVSYDIVDDNSKFNTLNKHKSFPTTVREAPTPLHYVPLSHSKASESIQRSMDKYRFGIM